LKDNTLIIFSRFLAAGLLGIFWLLLANFLDKSEYGELSYFVSFATVGSAVALLGLNKSLVVFAAKKEPFIADLTLLGIISSTVVSVISYFIIQNILVSLLIFGSTMFFLSISKLNADQKFRSYSAHVILQRSLCLVLSLIFVPLYGIQGALLGLTIANLPSFYELLFLIKSKLIGFSYLRPKLGFIANNYFIHLSSVTFWFGDKILIGSLYDFTILASYTIASQFIIFLSQFSQSISVYLLPKESMKHQNKKLKIYAIIIAFALFALSYSLVDILIPLLVPKYIDSIELLQIMTFSIVPMMIAIIIETELLGKERGLLVLLGTLIQLSTFSILVLLDVFAWGLLGLGIAFLTSFLIKLGYLVLIKRIIVNKIG
jgi:O-antigen/teichoic acid export membrane protein